MVSVVRVRIEPAPARRLWRRVDLGWHVILTSVLAIQWLGRPLARANPDSNRLYEDLMMSYNRFVRPVQNDSDLLTVKLGLKLSQLIDVVSIFACGDFCCSCWAAAPQVGRPQATDSWFHLDDRTSATR